MGKQVEVNGEKEVQQLVVVLTSKGWYDPRKYDVQHEQNRSMPENWVQWITNSKGQVAIFCQDVLDKRLTGEAYTDDKSKWLAIPFFDEPEDAVDYLWANRRRDNLFLVQIPAEKAYQIITEKPVVATEIENPIGQSEQEPAQEPVEEPAQEAAVEAAPEAADAVQ
jgi:hypothetical protein